MSVIRVLACLLLAACGTDGVAPSSPCEPTSGVVVRVLDGDTIDIDGGGRTVAVRYLLVDTPETREEECFADEAKRLNEMLVAGQEVELEYDGDDCTDMYGRNLAYVSIDGHMVNRILLERGYARLLVIRPSGSPEYRYEQEFTALEAAAEANSAGLWGVCE
jgi:micrococcal nuclease